MPSVYINGQNISHTCTIHCRQEGRAESSPCLLILGSKLRARHDGGIRAPSRQSHARRVDLVDLAENVWRSRGKRHGGSRDRVSGAVEIWWRTESVVICASTAVVYTCV